MYHLMSRLDLGDRVLYPQGGFTRLIEVIAGLAERHGARLHTGTAGHPDPHRRRPPRGRPRVTGVEHVDADGERRTARRPTWSSAPRTCTTSRPRCCPPTLQTHPRAGVAATARPGPGAVLAMLGVEGRLPQLAHHSLFFTSDWDQQLRRHLRPRRPRPGPRVDLRLQALGDRPHRGAGGHARTSSSSSRSRPTRRSARGGDDGQRVRGGGAGRRRGDRPGRRLGRRPRPARPHPGAPHRRPRGLRPPTTTPGAAAPSASSTRCARARSSGPGNVSSKVDGLLYAGASTVPGVGLPMCLISAELVLKRLQRRPRRRCRCADRGAGRGGSHEPAALGVRRACWPSASPGRCRSCPPSGCGCCGSHDGCCSPSSRPGRRSWCGTCTPPDVGHWWFDEDQTLPWRVAGLPLEEIALLRRHPAGRRC